MGGTGTSVLKILRNPNAPIGIVTSRQTHRPFKRLSQKFWFYGGGPQGKRLQHFMVWQNAQRAGLDVQSGRSIRFVAEWPRLRSGNVTIRKLDGYETTLSETQK